MLQIIWEFRVTSEHREAFERLYAAEGEWAQLFRRAAGFQGTALLRDPAVAGRYLTVDSWSDIASFDAFRKSFAAEYEALDTRSEELTEYEMKVGNFETP